MTTRTQTSRTTRVLASVGTALMVLGASLAHAPAASAYEPVGIVHTEQVQAGPYELTVGFSRWPLRAMQSLDFTFIPEGGIADKSGTLTLTGAETNEDLQGAPLARHPRKLEVWGLDVIALETAGEYTLDFEIDGPEGAATGTLDGIAVLPQPGPPVGVSWAVCSIPFLALVALVGVGWRRTRRPRDD